MDVSRYGELFLTESREHLSQANQALLDLESDPADGDAVNRIFRSVHTLKGMAGAMGFGDIERLSHALENRLDDVRSGATLNTSDVDLLFKAIDVLENLVAGAAGESSADSQPVDTLLTELVPAGRRSGEKRSPARPSRPSAQSASMAVNLKIRADAAMPGARAMMAVARVSDVAEVLSVTPELEAIDEQEFDGRLTILVSATADGDVIKRALSTVGDLDSVEIEKAGAEREKKAPRFRHIRVDLERLDALVNLIGELASERGRLLAIANRVDDSELEDSAQLVSKLTDAIRAEVLQARLTPVWQVFDRFPRVVRDLSRKLGKSVELEVIGKETEMDRAVLDEIGDPLVHLLRNAIDHGIESPEDRARAGKSASGHLVLAAERDRSGVVLRIQDDGRGINRDGLLERARDLELVGPGEQISTDEQLLRVLAAPGLSTATQVSEVSGRGVGIDAVVTTIERLGGAVELSSTQGKGTRWLLRIPTTLDIVHALLVGIGNERYAIPIHQIAETTDLDEGSLDTDDGTASMQYRDARIPLHDLRKLFRIEGDREEHAPVVIVEVGDRRAAIVVDRFDGQQEIVVKSFEPPRGTLPVFSGATLLSDGTPALILDAGGFVKERAEWMTN